MKILYLKSIKDTLVKTLNQTAIKIHKSSLSYHIYFIKPKIIMSDKKPDDTNNETLVNMKELKKTKTKLEIKEERKKALKERRQSRKEHKEVGFSNDILKQTDYYFENGLRKVYPYYFGWNTTAKERWFNRTLLDIYKSEFSRATINQNIENLILTGKIRCNGQIKPLDYKIKNGDRISHIKHRHEIPVLADKIKVIHDDENFVVVDKPSSIPIHPCGKYRYNSLSIILIKEMGYSNLRTMYRLDRLTSGLVILGKNLQSSLLIDKHIKERTAEKTYLCRVVGEFPNERITVDKPIDCASKKIGLYWVDAEKGKEAVTHFEKVSFNGKTSVVKCYPKTGRTHQIRIHLQYLGYPIINDPLYNQPTVWGKNNGKNGQYDLTKEEIEQNFLKVHTYEAWIIKQEQLDSESNEQEEGEEKNEDNSCKLKEETCANENDLNKINEVVENTNLKRKIEENNLEEEDTLKKSKIDEKEIEKLNEESKKDINPENSPITNDTIELKGDPNFPGYDEKKLTKDEECFECKQVYRDPKRTDLTMYLHALSYKFGDLEFKTEMPKWADENFIE